MPGAPEPRVHAASQTAIQRGTSIKLVRPRNLSFTGVLERMRFLIHDRDSKLSTSFGECSAAKGSR